MLCCSSCFRTPSRCTRSPSFRAVLRSAQPCGCRKRTNTPTARTNCSPAWRSAWADESRKKLSSVTSPTAPSGDIKMATAIARRMVCEWGMSEKMGMVEYGEHEDYVFLGRDISRARDYSEATAEADRPRSAQADRRRLRHGQGNTHGNAATSWKRLRKRCSNTKRSMASRSERSWSTAGC